MVTGQFLKKLGAVSAVALAMSPAIAFAQQSSAGHPEPGQIHLQPSVTPIMDSIVAFHDGPLMWTITIIVLFVLALLVAVVVRFNAKANPVPARFTHNTLIEVIWTVVPIVILIIIAIPSFGVLSDQMTVPDGERKYLGSNIFSFGEVEVPAPGLVVKVSGEQWYWNYEYVDQGVAFDSNILGSVATNYHQDIKPGQPRLLAVDNELVVPVDTTVQLQITSSPSGVIHAFAVPSFGIKVDAVPGRLNETWFNARQTGIYYGQCSELCGKDHAYMPIAVRVVTAEEFEAFITAFAENRDYAAAAAVLPAL
ncbi:Cytochrome c oxidase subunit 2 precursor [Devosia equisanguinis]|uniref:Cytochrome c oxidase subunit 2 n=2 Tax=Devosiaceae TaxID=2831106 RepID=A0A447I986_9HYPH|nr:MAG: cytochrome c oxidase subunit II [Pelagibacterium sp. SCN 63-126]ODU86367.1 MAG: cytochrome c oxidase subunit II [Pelagibacterium sp. SCN 63-17]OJX42736.1 MAG: cytochrome c oxidase subunit II [Devosia sp. 63-57]VDS04092.1 Cytochrome c oxidase subunit 2 precursor [Devosia equisanguinis]